MAAVSTITLESGCPGCAHGLQLTLQRDGSARLTQVGQARMGTRDEQFGGVLAAGEFEALAQQLAGAGFFEMAGSYEDPQTRDGSWWTISVKAGVLQHSVFSRDGAGPLALHSIYAAIERARANIQFKPIN